MNGTRARRAMSARAPASSLACCFALDDAGAGDQHDRVAAADRDVAQMQGIHPDIISVRSGVRARRAGQVRRLA